MCICYKFSAKYNRWYTAFFHVHCVACFLCLLALFFFGRLIFDDLDKRQFIHLSVHIVIFGCLLALLTGNRCSISRLYFVYFIGYHLTVLANIGLEIFNYYNTPHSIHTSLFTQSSSNETLISTMPPSLNVARFPNGQQSPYINMKEEALYALIFVCLMIQAYFTLVVYGSYKYLIDKNTKVHTLDTVIISSKPSTNHNEISIQDQQNPTTTPEITSNTPENKWEKRLNTAGTVVTFIAKFIPKK